MHKLLRASLGATVALALAAPALAQDGDNSTSSNWTGPYIGGSLGYSFQNGGGNETIGFDNDADGNFNNTVSTVGGANAFSPGFCGGTAIGSTPASGCSQDKDGTTWAIHAGYDVQFGNIVAGVVAEGGKTEISDSVSGFSITPARYTMTRSMDWNAALRARLGYSLPSNTLIYATGGLAYGKVKNSFATNNGFNTFTESRTKEDAWGWTAGGGLDQKVSDNFSVGVLYKYTRLDADGYRVNAGQGTPPSDTNPFVITSVGSTDFKRSNDRFDNHAVMATASFRF